MREIEPTGEIRFRTTWRNKMVLQIEVRCEDIDQHELIPFVYKKWRDAKPADIWWSPELHERMKFVYGKIVKTDPYE